MKNLGKILQDDAIKHIRANNDLASLERKEKTYHAVLDIYEDKKVRRDNIKFIQEQINNYNELLGEVRKRIKELRNEHTEN